MSRADSDGRSAKSGCPEDKSEDEDEESSHSNESSTVSVDGGNSIVSASARANGEVALTLSLASPTKQVLREQNEKLRDQIAKLQQTKGSGSSKSLKYAQESSFSTFISTTIFSAVKFPTAETLEESDWIMDKCYKHIGVNNPIEKIAYRDAVIRKLNHSCTQKRSYIKKEMEKKYHSML